MTFNIFYGGDDLDLTTGDFCEVADGCEETLQQVVATIRASGADVIGVQEPERNVARLGRELGYHYDERNHIISRYPIIDPPDGDGVFAYIRVAPGRVVAVANLHLPSDPYGPYLVRDGGNREELKALEETTRVPAIQPLLGKLPRLSARGIPVFVTGDFNSPSHLDWTRAVACVRPDVPFPFSWPASAALADAGLRDSYREAHPDPVAAPGFTWTPGGPESDPKEVFDRIDWVLTDGPTRTLSSEIVGESGGPDVSIERDPYPSDHRAVVSSFEVRPAEAPVLVAVSSRRVVVGETLRVTFENAARHGAAVAVSRARARQPLRAALSQSTRGAREGWLDFATTNLYQGAYEALLLGRDGQVLSRSPFWLYRPGTPTTLRTDQQRYRVGEPIRVSIANAPGMGLDWLAVFRCTIDSCEANSEYQLYTYTRAAVEGEVNLGPSALEGAQSWPLAAGRYVVRLLTDDGYVDVATSRQFAVR